jgi:hypothetical protein
MATRHTPAAAVLVLALCAGCCTASGGASSAPTSDQAVASTTPVTTPAACDCPCATTAPVADRGVPVTAVTLHGAFFTRATDELDIRRGKGLAVDAGTASDGRFLDRFQQWDEGAVWWEDLAIGDDDDRWIEIELRGTWAIGEAIVQADNNDSYRISYRDPATGDWKQLWVVPPDYAFGMVTRPSQYDDSARQAFPAVVTDALRVEALEGDGMYAVSEVEVFGTSADG